MFGLGRECSDNIALWSGGEERAPSAEIANAQTQQYFDIWGACVRRCTELYQSVAANATMVRGMRKACMYSLKCCMTKLIAMHTIMPGTDIAFGTDIALGKLGALYDITAPYNFVDHICNLLVTPNEWGEAAAAVDLAELLRNPVMVVQRASACDPYEYEEIDEADMHVRVKDNMDDLVDVVPPPPADASQLELDLMADGLNPAQIAEVMNAQNGGAGPSVPANNVWRTVQIEHTADDVCTICQHPMEPGESIVTPATACGHLYHRHCAEGFDGNGSTTCPNCRAIIPQYIDCTRE